MRLFDGDLLRLLEFRISGALSRAEDPVTRALWCDGVLPPPHDESAIRKLLHDRRRFDLEAFVGADGQGRWTLALHLGNLSVSRLARGLDLVPCVPDGTTKGGSWLARGTGNWTPGSGEPVARAAASHAGLGSSRTPRSGPTEIDRSASWKCTQGYDASSAP